jgi:hypothetical protein
MRDGIFSFYIRSDEVAIRAIALVENDSIRGFNRSISIPSNAYSMGCARIEKPIGGLKQRNTLTLKASPIVDFQRNLKAKREKSSFGSKEGLIQIVASGLKFKELGFKISRGIVGNSDRSD